MVYYPFNVMLKPNKYYVINNFCIYFHQNYWPLVFCFFFLIISLIGLGRINARLINQFGSVSFFSIFGSILRKTGTNSLDVR